MCADDDLADLTLVSAFRHGELEITGAGSPDIACPFANLLETLSARHLWLELIDDRLVFPDDHLRQRRWIDFITRPRKLPRNQVSLTLLQVRRHLRRLQRLKHLRRT